MKSKGCLIATQGVPASAKSTWAKEQLIQNPDWVHVERDLIRDELGIDRHNFNAELEKKVSALASERILSNLRAGKTVICSDTNLSYKTQKHLESLAEQAKAEMIWNKEFLNVPIEVCTVRDLQRKHSVGRYVIEKFYAKYRPNLEVKEEKVLIIGDIHSNDQKFLKVLNKAGIYRNKVWGGIQGWIYHWYNSEEYKVVLLGDLVDPRYATDAENLSMDSTECVNIAIQLYELGWLELVQSNHQLNLINWYRGTRKKLSYGLNFTINNLKETDQKMPGFLSKAIAFFESRPYYYAFLNNGVKYICSHAFYTEGMSQYNPIKEEACNSIYGLKEGSERKQWWLDSDFYSEDYVRVVGHFHEQGFFPSKENKKAILLDGGCGSPEGNLLGYLPHLDELIIV